MPSLATRNPAPTVVQDDVDLPPRVPGLPDDVLVRFPSLADWKEDVDAWWSHTYDAIQGNNRYVSQSVTRANTVSGDLRVSIDGATAAITTETDARVAADVILARRIVTVSAIAGVAQNITVQGTAPVGPVVNDYWVDNSDVLNPVTYQWNGAAWAEVTNPISAAAVAAEQSARITADGHLEGKYTLTVIAGNVVTGMNITSASGGGTNISSVIFRATDFQVYDGASGKVMFVADGAQNKVRIASVLTVDAATTSVYVRTAAGAGTYNDASTFWYVDAAGRMSLKTKFLWDGTTLAIDGSGTFSGTITASAGSIAGWSINASTIAANNAVLDSAGQLVLGTVNDVVYISATDANYRIWIGNATAGSAAFRVTKTGAMTASGGTFSGSVTSTSGTIGGFTLGANLLTGGSGVGTLSIYSDGSGVVLGNASGARVVVYADVPNSLDGFAVYNSANVKVGDFFLDTSGGANAGAINLYNSAGVLKVAIDGATGTVAGTTLSGNGSLITSLNASHISSGSLSIAGTITSTAAAVISGTKCEAPLGNFTDVAFSNTCSTAAGAATSILLTTAAGGAELKLGDTSAQYALLRRSSGGSVSLLLFNSSNIIAGSLQVVSGTGCGSLSLNDALGNAVVSFDANQSGGAPQFGTYTGGAPAATGFITLTDSAGNARKLLCG